MEFKNRINYLFNRVSTIILNVRKAIYKLVIVVDSFYSRKAQENYVMKMCNENFSEVFNV